jgi:coproporphyrinogen III oxidase-like Fe-S oxidoreductase
LRRRYFALGVKTHNVPLGPFENAYGTDPRIEFGGEFRALTDSDLASIIDDELRLTDVGRMFVDTCSSAFFSEGERGVSHPEEPEIRRAETQFAQ